MFSRRFMQAFKVRKNAIPSAYLGSISSNFTYTSQFDRIVGRFLIYATAAIMVTNATNNFEVFYEIFTHYPQPAFRTYYQFSVPQQIRKPNDQIMQKWKKVHEARKLLKTFQVTE